MSARQPFFSARPTSESQGTAEGFNQKTFLVDPSSPLHINSSQSNQLESVKAAFSVPGPFSSNSTNNAVQAKTSGLASISKKKSTDRKGSLNSVGLDDIRASTTDVIQFGFGYQKPLRRSLGLLDPGSIVRPGTAVPQSKVFQEHPIGFEIRAPIPKPAIPTSTFLSHNTFPEGIPTNDAHISTTEINHGVSRKVDVGDSTFHSSNKGSVPPFNQTGAQRIPIEQQFGQYNTSEVDPNASITSHEVTPDGRLRMSTSGQTKKRTRDEIEEDGDGSYWIENKPKRHKNEFENRRYAKSPPSSPQPEGTGSQVSHPEDDVRRHFPNARGTPQSSRYRERRAASPPYELPNMEQTSLDNSRNAFEKLLGRNTDLFVKQNMEKYDLLVKKWSECSEEEWIAGAEEIAEKYAKIVSYVKDSMAKKLKAYANIQVDIGRHLADLGERDELLDSAKKKLITESGNALG